MQGKFSQTNQCSSVHRASATEIVNLVQKSTDGRPVGPSHAKTTEMVFRAYLLDVHH